MIIISLCIPQTQLHPTFYKIEIGVHMLEILIVLCKNLSKKQQEDL